MELSKVKDESAQEAREYVAAYVDHIHTLEGKEAALKGHQRQMEGKH